MATLRLRAVVLRRIPYGDTSWILHVFSREQGSVGLMARGARRPKSPFAGALEPLGLSELEVVAKPGRDLQTLSQASALDSRDGLRADLAASAAAMVCAETVLRLVREPGEHPGVFAALEEAISGLDRSGYAPAPLWRFLGRFSEEMGWALAVDHCAQCGSEEIPPTPVLSLPQGGFLCRSCGPRSHEHPLPLRVCGALRAAACGVPFDQEPWTRAECDGLEDLWFEHLLRHAQSRPRLETRQFLSEVRP
ncbi:MAG TPA: DNA repair protein RecO [Fibrobacteria bacterium]|nr:DNA repair protein RecO [Fibrobacteria bacterium]